MSIAVLVVAMVAPGVPAAHAAEASPVVVGPELHPYGEMDAATGKTIGQMGQVLDTAGGVAIIGSGRSTVMILKRDGNEWRYAQTLDGFTNHPVNAGATDGSRIVLVDNGGSGTAYVFDRGIDGRWSAPVAHDVGMSSVFSMAVDGDLVAVSGTTAEGYSRVRVFSAEGGGWTRDGEFGGNSFAVAIHGDQLITNGAMFTRGEGGWAMSTPFGYPQLQIGIARVEFDGQTVVMAGRSSRGDVVSIWSHRPEGWWSGVELADPDGAGMNSFGASISLDGSRLMVGEDSHLTGVTDRAFVYGRAADGYNWTLTQTIADPHPDEDDRAFASGVALSGSVAGALSVSYNNGMGAWYSFDAETGEPTGELNRPASGAGGYLGIGGMTVDGNMAAALSSGGGSGHTTVEVFHRTAEGWQHTDSLTSPGTSDGSSAGLSPDLGGPILVHGGSIFVNGLVYRADRSAENKLLRFDKTGSGWVLAEERIDIPQTCATDERWIGAATFVGDDLVLSSHSGNYFTEACRHVLRSSGSGWSQVALPQGARWSNGNGYLATNPDHAILAVGAYDSIRGSGGPVDVLVRSTSGEYRLAGEFFPGGRYTSIAVTDSGAVAVLTDAGLKVWEPPADGSVSYEAAPTQFESAGYRHAQGLTGLAGGFVVNRESETGTSSIDVIARGASGWGVSSTVDSPTGQQGDDFGYSMATAGDRLLVSAPMWDSPAGADAGKVFAYTVTTPTAPDAVNGIVVTPADHSAKVTWEKPADDGGAPILGYTVTATPGGKACSTDSPDILSCTIDGLDNGVNYTFTVTARNAVGTSPTPPEPCDTCQQIVGPLPDPPHFDGPPIIPDDGTQATVRWLAAAAKDPNVPIAGYRVTAASDRDPASHICQVDDPAVLSCTVTGLTKGVDYTFTVQALTAAGPSPVTKPDAPTGVTATLGAGQSVAVAWTAPVNTGGATVAGYTVTASNGGGTCTTSGAPQCTVSGLDRGGRYMFTVVATNVKGDSDPSAPSNEVTIPTDTTGPEVTGTPDRPADAESDGTGWYRAPVTVTWTARDDVDGDVAAPPAVAVVEGSSQTATSAKVCDTAGNCSTGSFGPVNVDQTAPTIMADVSGSANGAGWRNQEPTVRFTCSDALSGVPACPDPVVVGEGAGQTVTRTVKDRAGNTASATVSALNVDLTPPALTGKPVGEAPPGGWYRGDVTVGWECADALSGIPDGGCPDDAVITGEGAGLTASGVVVDTAGNATTADSAPVNVDRTAPMTGVTAPQGWNSSTVTLTLDPLDALSGVKATTWTLDDADPVTSTTVTVTGQGRHALKFHSTDKAGNTEDPVEVVVLIDSSGPKVTHILAPQPNDEGWNNQPVTVTFSCTDTDSGVRSCTSPVTVTDDGAGQVITGEGVDNTGNRTVDQATVNVDRTAPTVGDTLGGQANSAGWYNTPVPVQWQCADALSGVDTCSDPVVLTETSPGPVTGTAVDVAGNTASRTQPTLKIDTTAPVVTINGPDNGAVYLLGTAPNATCTASDARSGLAGACRIDVTGGNANHVGEYTVTATATDKAGNTTMVTAIYHVQYAWNGFDQPINDTAHQVSQSISVFKAGSTVPTKFTLLGPDGQPVTPITAPKWITPTRGVATSLPVDETVYTDPADTFTTYTGSGAHWQHNWKTDKAQAGYYWRIGVRLDDGTTHYVSMALN